MPETFIIPWKGLMAKSWRPSKENKATLFIVSCLQLYHQGHIRNYTKKRLRDHSDERKAMPIYCNGQKKNSGGAFLFSCNIVFNSFNVFKVQVFLEGLKNLTNNLSINLLSFRTSKSQINWKILPIFCGRVRKPKLY